MGAVGGQTQNFSSTGSIGSKSCDPEPFERLKKPKMGSGRGQTQNFSSTGSIGSKSCDPEPFERLKKPKMGSGRGQNQNSGTIGSKSCDPSPPFERLPRRSKGGSGSQLFDPMVPLSARRR